MQAATNITIAVGYFGHETIQLFKKQLVSRSQQGRVRLLLGMVFHTGLGNKQQKLLDELNEALQSNDPESGVFISMREYHGKVYAFDDAIYVGSANFSAAGIESRLECTAYLTDQTSRNEVTEFLAFLFDPKVSPNIQKVDLQRRPPEAAASADLDRYAVPSMPQSEVVGSMKITLRVDSQPRSSLNLFFDKGRLVKATGKYSPRPWYEVEITTNASDREHPLYPVTLQRTPGKKSRVGAFWCYVEFRRKIYRIRMNVASDLGKAIMTGEESGGRETLGRIIKGKLEDSKVLRYGERITSQTLEDYGQDYIKLTKIDDDNYILEF